MNFNRYILREYDIRGVVGKDLTEEVVYDLGRAFGTYLRETGVRDAVVGGDCRLSSPSFRNAAGKGLAKTGINVLDIGTAPTPLLYFSLFHFGIDGGVMVTGSHNPPDYNGFKLCSGKQAIFGGEIAKVGNILESGRFTDGSGTITTGDAIKPYQEFLLENIKPGSRKLRVCLDAGNGTGGVPALPVLERLGMEVAPLFCEMDGRFPNHHPDPTVLKNLDPLIAEVKRTKADIGIAYDGDADRIGVVDEQGSVIFGDRLLIILARDILRETPGAAVVSEVKCSSLLFDEIERLGGRGIMWKVGHSLIKAKMIEEDALLGGEMSGHIFYKHRYFGFDDAIYTSLRLLEILSRTDAALSSLLDGVPKMSSTPEIRIDCEDMIKFDVVKKAVEAFRKTREVIDIDGARVVFDGGWGLVRASNTQPVLVFRFEAVDDATLSKIQGEMTAAVNRIINGM
ncbi:MAG: phosphomannomutase/phosphoglucomutase [Deltaproteobacteria bacterium]|nr:phosphomannomutase/phosphoglucomutase [Deltaproteobacteria bacterium]